MTALALALQLLVLGLHVVVPWRLARTSDDPSGPSSHLPGDLSRGGGDGKRLWALIATPLLLAAAVAALFTVDARVDAAIAWRLSWPPATIPALAVGFTAVAVALCDLLLLAGFRRLEPAGWRIAAGLALMLLAAASFAGELLRLGRGPAAGLAGLLVAALCRLPLALAAGEAASGPVRWLAPLAGVALPFSLVGFSAPVRATLGADLATLAAATLLLLAARFVPLSLRRPAALAGVLLAALFLDRTADLSAAIERGPTFPDIFLPEP
jgi:hypothetical protein